MSRAMYNAVVNQLLKTPNANCIGEGQYGRVYKCELSPSQYVAVKRVEREKFESTEVHALRALDASPYVIDLLDISVHDAYVYMMFPLFKCSLHDALFRGAYGADEMTFYLRMAFALCIVNGLCDMHDKGIVHGDITSANLLCSGYRVVYADFGMAQTYKDAVFVYTKDIEYTHALTTCQYRAPEMMRRANYNGAIDVFSMGCVLYELFTGSRLFPDVRGDNDVQLVEKRVTALSGRIIMPDVLCACLMVEPAIRAEASAVADMFLSKATTEQCKMLFATTKACDKNSLLCTDTLDALA